MSYMFTNTGEKPYKRSHCNKCGKCLQNRRIKDAQILPQWGEAIFGRKFVVVVVFEMQSDTKLIIKKTDSLAPKMDTSQKGGGSQDVGVEYICLQNSQFSFQKWLRPTVAKFVPL